MADEKTLLEKFGEFLEAEQQAKQQASASEYDGDDFEWWEEDKEGNRRGSRTTVRAARQHGPDWAKKFFEDKKKDDKGGQGDGGQGDGGKPPARSLFAGTRKPPAGSQGS